MSVNEANPSNLSTSTLPGLGRTLVMAGKLDQKFAEDIFRKATTKRSSFIAELTGSGAVSAVDLAHTLSHAFSIPLIDLDAVDPQRLPKGLLDNKICQDFRLVVLGKRQNRLIVATADPTDQQSAERPKSMTRRWSSFCTRCWWTPSACARPICILSPTSTLPGAFSH
jgi:type IV pilus assembly protein PilB